MCVTPRFYDVASHKNINFLRLKARHQVEISNCFTPRSKASHHICVIQRYTGYDLAKSGQKSKLKQHPILMGIIPTIFTSIDTGTSSHYES